MLTSKKDIFHKVTTLGIGAYDYIVKPFEKQELIARMRAVSRRYYFNDRIYNGQVAMKKKNSKYVGKCN